MAQKKKKKKPQNQPKPVKKSSDKGWNIALIVIGALILALLVFIVARIAKTPSNTAEPTQEQLEEIVNDVAETSQSIEEEAVEQPAEEAADDSVITAVSPDFDVNADYYADITVKDYGTITVRLDPRSAPISVENFVNLAQSGFYDGLTFHRIMSGFMMQGGDPTATGGGGSDKNIKGEFAANGVENNLSHTRGAISMARATPMDSASSQFFIVHEDSTFLDGSYACFGYVTEGMEYVDAICADSQPTDDNGTIPFDAQPVMESVVIRVE